MSRIPRPGLPVVRLLALLALASAFAAAMSSTSCRVYEPSNKPLDRCRHSCEAKAKRQCSAESCERGCEFILDRIVEREGDSVIACVAARSRRCDDVVWADCAAQIGPHADGGPPGPPPPSEEE